jgi:hypothetical protein
VPIISANISWLILGTTVSGLFSLPNWASKATVPTFFYVQKDQLRVTVTSANGKEDPGVGGKQK